MTTPHQQSAATSAATSAPGPSATGHHDQAAGPRDRAVGHRTRQVIATTAGVFLATAFLAACSNPNPGPSLPPRESSWAPMPTTTTTPTLSAKDKNIADAESTYREYMAARNEVEKAGMKDWMQKVIVPYVSGDWRVDFIAFYQSVSEDGVYQTGDHVVRDVSVLEYAEDPTGGGGEQVTFRLCSDDTAVNYIDGEGESRIPPGAPRATIQHVTMVHQSGAGWTVDSIDPREEAC